MKNFLIIFTASILLMACQQSEVVNTKANTDKVATTAYNSNLDVAHTFSAERAQVGVPYKVMLDFSGSADSVLNAEFSTSNGLNMMSETSASLQMDKAGKAETQTITVIPQTEGIHYINIMQPGAQQKPSVIRVIAGDKDIKEYLKTPGKVVEQEDGTKVITMKADEG